MRTGEIKRLSGVARMIGAALMLLTSASAFTPVLAQAPAAAPAAEETAPTPAAPKEDAAVSPSDPSAAPAESEQSATAPGVPTDATTVTLEIPARPVALLSGESDWANSYKSIMEAIAKVDAAVKEAGLTPAGRPLAVFLATDEASFHFEAMVPLAEKPEGRTELPGGVRFGTSPSGKAMKFLHRGAYDDIDATYDLITAFLDEKGLEARNLFVEEYLSETKETSDPNLEADIYVFLK
jgi:effector-binding domain-containing protein